MSKLTFELTESQVEKMNEWIDGRSEYSGAIGGQFKIEFLMTSIGDLASVVDTKTGESLDLTNYDDF